MNVKFFFGENEFSISIKKKRNVEFKDCSHFSTRPFSSLKLFMTHYIREFCVFVHAQNDMMKNFKARGKKLLLFRRKKSE